MGVFTETTDPAPTRQGPLREDSWTEGATSTLLDVWGQRFLELNRGKLRQKDWQEVADTVNASHGYNKMIRRTDSQCKSRIDTLKKKYKSERAKFVESNGTLTSLWPFFPRLEFLTGSNIGKNHQNNPITSAVTIASSPPQLSLLSPPLAVSRSPLTSVVGTPVSLPQKRPLLSPVLDQSFFRKNYSAMAAAAAAADDEDGELEGDESKGSEDGAGEEDEVWQEGMRRLARAMEKFGETFEKVEGMLQRQMLALEKQRMQFIKDLEVQRMQLFTDSQIQLKKIKRPKRPGSSDDFGTMQY